MDVSSVHHGRYTEEKTSDVIEYGALLRLMGDMLQHRYKNHHHR